MPDVKRVRLMHSRQVHQVGRPLGAGGAEGTPCLHEGNDGVVFKVFNDILSADELRKMEYLIAHPVIPSRSTHQYCFPLDIILDDETRDPVGIVMKKVDDGIDLLFVIRSSRWLPKAFLIRVANNLTASLRDLHKADYFRRDFLNALVLRDGSIVEIDLDSLQVGTEFRSAWCKPDYLGPELLQVIDREDSLSNTNVTAKNDLFGNTIQLWQLLRGDGDVHPFDSHFTGTGNKPRRLEAIRQGYFCWCGKHPDFEPPTDAPPITNVELAARTLFFQCFDDGHADPTKRPSLERWLEVLETLDVDGSVKLSEAAWQSARDQTEQPAAPLFEADRAKPRAAMIGAVPLRVGVGVAAASLLLWNSYQERWSIPPRKANGTAGLPIETALPHPTHPSGQKFLHEVADLPDPTEGKRPPLFDAVKSGRLSFSGDSGD